MTDLERATAELENGKHTIVLVKGNNIIKSAERGVAPLLQLIESGDDYSSYSASDKVIGKAAAFLYIILGIKNIHGKVISKLAADIFDKFNIDIICYHKYNFTNHVF